MAKPDAHLISAHLSNLKNEPWMAQSQAWWVDHLFHFTDISNAVEILKSGCLLSRIALEKEGRLATDIATRFSDGNLATDANVGETVDFLLSLPFEKIYHDGSLWGLSDGAKRNIIFHRHAEVIIPNKMDLTDLKLIWCRSQAEFETLIDLLPVKIYSKWAKKIGVGNKSSLFFTKWPFITKSDLSNSSISFSFNPSLTPGPFHASLEITEQKTKDEFTWEDLDFYAKDTKSFSLSNLKYPDNYRVLFWLDGHLAYQNQFIDESQLPF